MKRKPWTLFACAIAMILLHPIAHGAPVHAHVAVISVDGLGASQIFGMPTCVPADGVIRNLARKGAYSRGLRSVFPAITYPAHASMVTGLDPDGHGVIDNGVGGRWFNKREDIHGDTLWDAARRSGRTVAIITWPSTYGANVDWLVPEDLSNSTAPTEQIRAGSTPGLFDSLSAVAGEPHLVPFGNPDAGESLDRMTAGFAIEAVKRFKPDLLLVHFLDFDHRMHAGPGSAEACSALRHIDGYIGSIVEAYRAASILDRTTFFVVSDHGFLPVKELISVYGLLEDAGWNQLFPGRDPHKTFDLKVPGGSVAFYPASELDAQSRKRMISALRPRVERKFGKALKWITPESARAMGGFPGAAFSLCARPGYAFAILPESQHGAFAAPGGLRGTHGYCPTEPAMDAVFIASGYRISASGPQPKMMMKDVGPTIAAFLTAKISDATGRDRSSWFLSGRAAAAKPGSAGR